MTADEWVRQVLGVDVKGAGNPSRVVIEASPQAISEIERRFGDKVIVEPEIRHERLEALAAKPPEAAAELSSGPQLLDQWLTWMALVVGERQNQNSASVRYMCRDHWAFWWTRRRLRTLVQERVSARPAGG
jgi:hypothetical protein